MPHSHLRPAVVLIPGPELASATRVLLLHRQRSVPVAVVVWLCCGLPSGFSKLSWNCAV